MRDPTGPEYTRVDRQRPARRGSLRWVPAPTELLDAINALRSELPGQGEQLRAIGNAVASWPGGTKRLVDIEADGYFAERAVKASNADLARVLT
jgi:hypothetical protein